MNVPIERDPVKNPYKKTPLKVLHEMQKAEWEKEQRKVKESERNLEPEPGFPGDKR